MVGAKLDVRRIRELARDETFVGAVAELYASLDARVTARRPVCINRGDCCKFGSFGHSLFVTPVELAYFIATTGDPVLPLRNDASCPYQQGGLCTTRAGRPTGCRIFFCEAVSQFWQGDETENTLREIKDLHRRFDVPYAYVEWLDALRQLSCDDSCVSNGEIDSPVGVP